MLEKRVLGRAKYSGRSDDNIETMKLRFDTFNAETLPIVKLFRSQKKCVETDSSEDRQTVYALVSSNLAEHTDKDLVNKPLTENSEILLGAKLKAIKRKG